MSTEFNLQKMHTRSLRDIAFILVSSFEQRECAAAMTVPGSCVAGRAGEGGGKHQQHGQERLEHEAGGGELMCPGGEVWDKVRSNFSQKIFSSGLPKRN